MRSRMPQNGMTCTGRDFVDIWPERGIAFGNGHRNQPTNALRLLMLVQYNEVRRGGFMTLRE